MKFNNPMIIKVQSSNLSYAQNLYEVGTPILNQVAELQAKQHKALMALAELNKEIAAFEDSLLDDWTRKEIMTAIRQK